MARNGARVVIDALAARFGGTAYASVQLARHLAMRPEISAVAVITRRGSKIDSGARGYQGVEVMALKRRDRFELASRVTWEATRLRRLVADSRIDALITMSGMLPVPPTRRLLCILLNPVMYEENGYANRVRRWAVRRTVANASFLAAPTRHLAELVTASTGRHCEVAPLGVDHAVFFPSRSGGQEVLCVADFYRHKRHDLVVRAWAELDAPRPVLRLVGNPGVDKATYRSLTAELTRLPEQSKIIIERELSLVQLVARYQAARVFVMPSERESFSMPLAETMACGVPPIVRRIPSLLETGGSGAIFVDRDDPALWAAEMAALLEDDQLYRRARQAAITSAARFSWEALSTTIAAQL